MDRFSREHSCTICHDYGSSECGCPSEAQAEIARLQAEVERLKSAVVSLNQYADSVRDTARNDALDEAAYNVAELAEHDAEERDWKDGARQARNIAAAIRALKH
jgi:hypothetical protein